jgi:AraC-like DNA-binding protein
MPSRDPPASPSGTRREFSRRRCLAAGLDILGYDAPRRAGVLPLGRHHHAGAFEVCLILDGVVEWWANEEQEVHRIGPGEIYLTRPDEPHGAVNATIQPSSFYWVQTSLRDGPAAMSLRDRATVRRVLSSAPRRFRASSRLIDLHHNLMAEHEQTDALSGPAAEALFQQLIVQLVRDAQRAQPQRQALSPAVLAAQRWLLDHLEEPVGIEDAAAAAGLSLTRLHERFREEVGQPPADWRNHRRLDRARRLLADTDLRITDIAVRCGFATSQYFATAFRKQVGLSPSAYRRRAMPPKEEEDAERGG